MIKAIERIKQLSCAHQYNTIQIMTNQFLKIKERVELSTIYKINFINDNENFDFFQNEFQEAFDKLDKIIKNFTKNKNQRKKTTNIFKRR